MFVQNIPPHYGQFHLSKEQKTKFFLFLLKHFPLVKAQIDEIQRRNAIRKCIKLDSSYDFAALEKVAACLCSIFVIKHLQSVEKKNRESEIRCQLIQRISSKWNIQPFYYELSVQTVGYILLIDLFADLFKKGELTLLGSQLLILFLGRVLNNSVDVEAFDAFITEMERGGVQTSRTNLDEISRLKGLRHLLLPYEKNELTLGEICGRTADHPFEKERLLREGLLDLINKTKKFSKILQSCLSINLEVVLQLYLGLQSVDASVKETKGLPFCDPARAMLANSLHNWLPAARSLLKIFSARHRIILSSLSEIEHHLSTNPYLNEEALSYYDRQIVQNFGLLKKSIAAFIEETRSIEMMAAAGLSSEELKRVHTEVNKSFVRLDNSDAAQEARSLEEHDALHLGLQLYCQAFLASGNFKKSDVALIFEESKKKYLMLTRLLKGLTHGQTGIQALDTLFVSIRKLNTALEANCTAKEKTVDLSWVLKDKAIPVLRNREKKQAARTNKKVFKGNIAPVAVQKLTARKIGRKKKSVQHKQIEAPFSFFQFLHSISEKSGSRQDRSVRAHLCLKNAYYHLSVLGSAIDLLRMQPFGRDLFLFRLARSGSLAMEALATHRYLTKKEKGEVQHNSIYLLQSIGEWSALSLEMQERLMSSNGGTVFHRYPHYCYSRLQSKGESIPQVLDWLVNPQQCELKSFMEFCLGPYKFLDICQGGSHYDSLHMQLTKSLEQEAANKQTAPPFARKLSGDLQPAIMLCDSSIHQAEKMLNERKYPERMHLNLLDCLFHLRYLKQDLELWALFPHTAFLPTHVDAILTHLQFLDELLQETLHMHLFKVDLQTHDLIGLRILLAQREDAETKEAIANLNIHKWAQNPHEGAQEIRAYNSQRKKNEAVLAVPKGVSWRLLAVEFSKNAEAYDVGFIPAKKGRKTKVQNDGPFELQKELVEYTKRFLTIAQRGLLQLECYDTI